MAFVYMGEILLFGANVAITMFVWSYALVRWLRPWMRTQTMAVAMTPILLLHATRANGIGFVLDGVVAPSLVHDMAVPAAAGDVISSIVAIVCLFAWKHGERTGKFFAWSFSIVGMIDLVMVAVLVGMYQVRPGDLGAMYLIVVGVVPGLIITHLLVIERLRQIR